MPASYSITSTPSPGQLEAVDNVLDEFNMQHGAMREVQRLSVIAEDDHGQVIGGAIGWTGGKCCELQQLAVHSGHRSQGIGEKLLQHFEQEAATRGCTLAYLDTFSFQAPLFYLRCGYRVALETTGFTKGVIKYTMQKALQSAATEA